MALDIKSRKTTYHSARNMHNQGRAAKRVKRIVISIFVVLLLLIIAALAYTWYMGQFKPVPVPEAPKPRQTNVLPPPTTVDDKAKVGVSSQTFTSKVVIGQNASVSIKTNPLAACSILVEYNKEKSTDSGLVPKKADDYGVVSWGWTVEMSRPPGKWPVTVTCANAKNSGVLILDLYVVNPE
jgi:hypothetical protein